MTVELFIPCFIEHFKPDTALSVKKILEKTGCSTHYNPSQTCCGQPAYNSGFIKEARKLALKFFDDFDNENIIVSPSASCTGYIRNYFKTLFEEGTAESQKAEMLSERIFELTDFLVNSLQFTDFNSVFNHRVTFHDSCAGLREYGIKKEPRVLLQNVKGLELVEMDHTDVCCGFGGTFAAKFHSISTAMTQQKVENALNSGAEYIVSTEVSCLLNIESYIKKQKLPVKTIHIADLIACF